MDDSFERTEPARVAHRLGASPLRDKGQFGL